MYYTVQTVNDVLSRSTPLDQKGVDRLNSKGVDRLRTSLTVRTVCSSAFILLFDHFLDSGAEICQFFCCFLENLQTSKRHSEII